MPVCKLIQGCNLTEICLKEEIMVENLTEITVLDYFIKQECAKLSSILSFSGISHATRNFLASLKASCFSNTKFQHNRSFLPLDHGT